VIILETEGRSDILTGLDQLATVCDSGSRVLRDRPCQRCHALSRAGAPRCQDYVIAPVNTIDVVRSVCGLFSARSKGGLAVHRHRRSQRRVGASTIAHNVAWAIARDLALDSVVADLDLAFGTAVSTTIRIPRRDRRRGYFARSMSIRRYRPPAVEMYRPPQPAAAPATLGGVYDFGADAFDSIFDTLRTTMPCIVLDVPHQWSGWTRRALIGADDILIVAAPDLANLRNTKNIFDLLKTSRPNDLGAALLSHQSASERPKSTQAISPKPSRARRCSDSIRPQMFGSAANNGQMIAEISANHRTPDVSADRATADRPWRNQKAAGFVPVTPPR